MDHNDHRNNPTNPADPTGPGGYMKLAGIEDGEFDALADLFLGESELAPEPFSQTGTDSVEPVSKPQPSPPPTRFQSSDHKQAQSTITLADPEIPDHRLTPPNPAKLRAPSVEAVLLGHLPVRASLWVRQYACSTARRRGETVALIRAAAGSTSVDLISATNTIESSVCTNLHDALSHVHTLAERVILRVDETTEPELLDRQEIDEITILTGADEAAIVASYRLIKTLTGVWDSDEMMSTPHIRLAVMGATGQQVADASTKLSRAVDAFLDRPIEIIDAAGRIDATATTNIFRDTVAHQASGILDALSDASTNTPEPAPHLSQFSQAHTDPNPQPATNSLRLSMDETKPMVTEQTTALCKGLGTLIDGLSVLETRCPFALDVELCIDNAGQLNLVAGDDHENPMVRLETVRSWVRDHLPLILRAEPALAMPDPLDRSSDIGQHLITVNPQSFRGLMDSPVRIYALAKISIADQTATVATPIN